MVELLIVAVVLAGAYWACALMGKQIFKDLDRWKRK